MKVLIPVLGLSAVYAQGTGSGGISSNPKDDENQVEEETDPSGRRISYQYRTMMSAVLANKYPRLVGQANLHKWVNRVLRNYGCNCFVRVTGDKQKGLNMCRVNGAPINELDAICNKYARMYKCMERSTGEFDFEGGWTENQFKEESMLDLSDGSRPGRWLTKCGAHTHFKWHVSGGEVVCGPASDPGYANSLDVNSCPNTACETSRQLIEEVVAADDRWEYPENFFRENKAAGLYDMHDDPVQCVKDPHETNECCGDFPSSSAYGMVTPFNDQTHECCFGEVVEPGAC